MIGYSQAILYVLIIATSTIWVGSLGDHISIGLLLLGASLVAILFFNMIRYKHFIHNHKTITQTPILWLLMTISLLLIWWLTYYSAIHSSASFVIATVFLLQATCAAAIKKHIISVVLSLLVWISIYYLAPNSTPITFVTASLTGILMYIYYRLSLAYAIKYKMKALDILAIRFYPLLLFSLIYILFEAQQHLPLYTGSNLQEIIIVLIILGFLNMVIPNFFSHSSILNIGAEKFSFITTSTPLLTFLLEGVFLTTWSWTLLLACSLSSLVLNIKIFIKGSSGNLKRAQAD